jgi:hypothetical protein
MKLFSYKIHHTSILPVRLIQSFLVRIAPASALAILPVVVMQ